MIQAFVLYCVLGKPRNDTVLTQLYIFMSKLAHGSVYVLVNCRTTSGEGFVLNVGNTCTLFTFNTCSHTHKIRQKPSPYTELSSFLGGTKNPAQY